LEKLKISSNTAISTAANVQKLTIENRFFDGQTTSLKLGLDDSNPYAQLINKYYYEDNSGTQNEIYSAADFSEYGTVLMAEHNIGTGTDDNMAFANVTYKDTNAVTRTNVKEYITTEINNALINAIEKAGEAQGKDYTIKLHLETEPKNGEAAVYSFKMPDRMVSAEDFGQGYLRDVTFYNNTFVEQTVLVKDGEYGDFQKLTIKPFKTATITISDGQKGYIKIDAVPATLTDKFLGTTNIAATFGKTLELTGGYGKNNINEELFKVNGRGVGIKKTTLQAEATLAVTDATTFTLNANTGNKIVVLNGRYSLGGMLSVRPFVGPYISADQ